MKFYNYPIHIIQILILHMHQAASGTSALGYDIHKKRGVSLEGALGMRKNFTDERNEVNFRSKLNDVGMKFLSSPLKSLVSNNKNPELFNSNIIEQ